MDNKVPLNNSVRSAMLASWIALAGNMNENSAQTSCQTSLVSLLSLAVAVLHIYGFDGKNPL